MTTITLDPSTDTIASVPRPRYTPRNVYKDRNFEGGEEARQKLLDGSSTVYVGNLSFYTSESQLYELFSRCGDIKRVIMGLDRIKKTPCGFCFVEYEERKSAEMCISFLNHTQLDGRQLQVDIDTGFVEGRQYGRGKRGGQVGDERNDAGNNEGGASSGGDRKRGGGGGGGGPSKMAMYSTAIVMILAILICYPLTIQSYPTITVSTSHSHRYPESYSNQQSRLRRVQASAQGAAFENTFAKLLVDIMKTSKPTLMQAFMRATLEDPKLKEIAISIFFNASSTGV